MDRVPPVGEGRSGDDGDEVLDGQDDEEHQHGAAERGVVPALGVVGRKKRRIDITMQTMAARLMTRPIAGPTPLARPSAGRTNGNTTYISRHRNVATMSDVWNALRAPFAEPGGASSGSRRRRRMKRSAGVRSVGGPIGAACAA